MNNSSQLTNYHEILSTLISIEEKKKCSNEIIKEKLEKVFSLLSDKDKEYIKNIWHEVESVDNHQWKYFLLITFIIQKIKNSNQKIFSVKQIQVLKNAVEIITLLGIKPNCLLFDKSKSNAQEKLEFLQKHKRLVSSIDFLLSCFDEPLLRSALLSQFGVILTALMFISHAKFTAPKSETTLSNNEFCMTPELYTQLKKEQEEFKGKLLKVIENCPQPMVMKDLMVIHGTEKYPKFVRIPAKKYLIESIMKPFGVVAFIEAMCDDDDYTDLGKHWNKLEIVGKLLASSQSTDVDKYYDAICPQFIEILSTGKIKQSVTIANCCIRALWEHNADICTKKIFNIIATPFLTQPKDNANSGIVLRTEKEVSKSVENLSKCFTTNEADFNQLPTEMLVRIAVPLFHLHIKSYKSISALRGIVRQLLLKVLSLEETCEDLFSKILNYNSRLQKNDFGQKLCFQLGPSGAFEIVEKAEDVEYEELANVLFDLVCMDKLISSYLFNFLLKSLSSCRNTEIKNVLENSLDVMNRMEQHLAAVNLLSRLAGTANVQESSFENPIILLSFVKSLFEEKKSAEQDEGSVNVAYIGLMLIKIILTERKSSGNWEPFDEFTRFLASVSIGVNEVPATTASLVKEVMTLVKTRGKLARKQYQDLTVNNETQSDFEKALQDLADPLLPVRAHGLIVLTKLIENTDAETVAKKDVLICLFQENLKHEDSFLYLAAVNGLCALAQQFPQNVIELLIQEFIDMPQRAVGGDFSSENRAKLGEILVKTTRALGEMAAKYKTFLINGFLCATRDPDPLVRASSLSCIGELCKILGFRLGNLIVEVLYCIRCIIKTDKQPECRRAAVLVTTLLLRGLGRDGLNSLKNELVALYRALKYLRDNDNDDVMRLHAQLALEEIDDIVKNHLFAKPKLEKTIFLLK